MEQIKVIFFLLGSIFAQENSRIASAITQIQVDVVQKTIQIEQQHVFTASESTAAFDRTKAQLKDIIENTKLSEELKNFQLKSLVFSKEADKLNATILLTYKSKEDLRAMGLFTTKEGELSHINIPDWKISTKEGMLKEKYWYFPVDRPFTFTIDMNEKMNASYKDKLQSLLPVWEKMKAEN
ncbi:hypothetical protein [Ascidiimonas sp. W6]|uniref:hypothetical protein n=1 Tax=Ascidiimonas meishanensis TaxID=3128903 RepID=UPI0030EE0E43